MWSSSSVRGMRNIVKPSKSYKFILQWTTLMSTKMKYIQSALWICNSCCQHLCDGTCKTLLICFDSKQKNKDTIAAFLFHLYDQHIPPREGISSAVIWSNSLSSKFKNRYTVHLMKIVFSIRCKTAFTCKYFATSNGKGIVDRIGGRPKSLVWQKVMRKSKGWLIFQNAEEFTMAAKALIEKLRVIFVGQNEIREFRENELFSKDYCCAGGVTNSYCQLWSFNIWVLHL